MTNRLRYYSFLPWFLSCANEKKLSWNDFVTFLRRAEFLFGLITEFSNPPGTQSVPQSMVGANTISLAVYKLQKGESVLLSSYTTPGREPNYWQHGLGGFGQYYAGPLMDLNIISREGARAYKLLPRGQALAKAFGGNVLKDEFWKCLESDSVIKSDIIKFQPFFDANQVKWGSDEHRLLGEYLKAEDYGALDLKKDPLQFRRDTLAILFVILELIQRPAHVWEILNILLYGFSSDGKTLTVPPKLRKTAALWQYYATHEYFSMALSGIFTALQHKLIIPVGREEVTSYVWSNLVETFDKRALPSYIHEFTDAISNRATLDSLIDLCNSVRIPEQVWTKGSLSEWNLGNFLMDDCRRRPRADSYFWAGLVLLVLCAQRNQSLVEPFELGSEHLFRDYTVNLARFRHDVSLQRSQPIVRLLNDVLVKYILDRHWDVALYKMFSYGLATFRFTRENGNYEYLEIDGRQPDDIPSGQPRLHNGLRIMADLGIVSYKSEGFFITDSTKGKEYFASVLD